MKKSILFVCLLVLTFGARSLVGMNKGPGGNKLEISKQENLKYLNKASKSLARIKLHRVNLEGADLSRFKNLQYLVIDECTNMSQTLLNTVSENLPRLKLWYVDLKDINLSLFKNLQALEIDECDNLFQTLFNTVSDSLTRIKLRRNSLEGVKDLSRFKNLQSLEISDCVNVNSILKKNSKYLDKTSFTLKGRQLNNLQDFKYRNPQREKDIIERLEYLHFLDELLHSPNSSTPKNLT